MDLTVRLDDRRKLLGIAGKNRLLPQCRNHEGRRPYYLTGFVADDERPWPCGLQDMMPLDRRGDRDPYNTGAMGDAFDIRAKLLACGRQAILPSDIFGNLAF